tara:strand:+ start:540 stop:731 length:192 start_codon:yes stop_codon:yes gene_type:complete
MKFLSQEQKEVIAKSHGITVESINNRIEIWSVLNDPDTSKPDLIAAQKAWINIQQGTWPNVNA